MEFVKVAAIVTLAAAIVMETIANSCNSSSHGGGLEWDYPNY